MTSDGKALRAAQAAIMASGPGNQDLCTPCLTVLPVTGMAVSTLSGPINNNTVCSSDDVAHRLDELQLDLGEGPCWEAFASRRAVLVPDLRAGRHPEWPIFADAAMETTAAAIFAFPLYVGWTGVGALDLYCAEPGDLDATALHDAGVLAATIAVELVRRIIAGDEDLGGHGAAEPWRSWPSDRRQIHQATGMLIDQLDLPVGAAFARLRAYAFATNQSVSEVAQQILAGALLFQSDDR